MSIFCFWKCQILMSIRNLVNHCEKLYDLIPLNNHICYSIRFSMKVIHSPIWHPINSFYFFKRNFHNQPQFRINSIIKLDRTTYSNKTYFSFLTNMIFYKCCFWIQNELISWKFNQHFLNTVNQPQHNRYKTLITHASWIKHPNEIFGDLK